MKQTTTVVRCIYEDGDGGKSLGELLEESFRLYLIRTLGAWEKKAGQNGLGPEGDLCART